MVAIVTAASASDSFANCSEKEGASVETQPQLAEKQKSSRRVQRYGRWSMAAVITLVSGAVLVADLAVGGSINLSLVSDAIASLLHGSYTAELTALISMSVLCLTSTTALPRHAQASGKKQPRAMGVAGKKASVHPLGLAKQAGCKHPTEKSGSIEKRQAEHTSQVSRLNQAINAAAQRGDRVQAEKLLQDAEASQVKPDAVSYNLIIRVCAKRGEAAAAEKWMRRMEDRQVEATLCSYNTLLDAFAKGNKAEACEQWLGRMLDRGLDVNVISYATVMYAFARRGDIEKAQAWLQRMIAAGIEPDVVSYNSLIHACSVKGQARAAEHWLQEMLTRGLETTVSTYTAVIDACAKCGDVERAESWFASMLDRGVEPNVITFSAMIDACAKASNLPRAEYWHERMLQKGIAPNAHSYTALISACAKRANTQGAEAAEQWLDRSEQAGVVNDVVVYSSVIDACGKAKDAERALRVFHRMRARGLKPHVVAYAALARPFAYSGDWIKVESIAKDMKADGIATNEYFLYAHLLAYATCRPRQAEKAEECFRQAMQVGVQPNDYVVGVLVRAVGRPRCAELMHELCGGREIPAPPSRRGQQEAGSGATRPEGGRPGPACRR